MAADFATLGAYELSGPEDEAEARPARRATKQVVREAPPKRVLLFAKVATPCPHSASVERTCTERVSRPERSRLRDRGGAVRAPEQPCLCAGERTPAG